MGQKLVAWIAKNKVSTLTKKNKDNGLRVVWERKFWRIMQRHCSSVVTSTNNLIGKDEMNKWISMRVYVCVCVCIMHRPRFSFVLPLEMAYFYKVWKRKVQTSTNVTSKNPWISVLVLVIYLFKMKHESIDGQRCTRMVRRVQFKP